MHPARRLAPVAAIVGALLVLLPGTALAHASFDVSQLPAGVSQELVLRVPLEREAANQRVEVLVPGAFTVESCDGATGWTCEQATTAEDDTVLTLERAPDGPGDTERFALTVTAPTEEGVYAFPTIQTYDDGDEAAWIGEPDSDRPAPRIQVGDESTEVEFSGDATPHTDLATPTPDATATEDPSEEPTATTAPTPTASPTPTATIESEAPSVQDSPTPGDADPPEQQPDTEEDEGSSAVVWILVASLLAVAIALAVARVRRQG